VEKVQEHTAAAVAAEAGALGPVLVPLADLVGVAEILNTRGPLTRETPRAVVEPVEHRGDLRRTVATRKTAAEGVRLVVMSARRVRPVVLVSSEPVPEVERAALNREVKTAEPVAIGNHTPRAVAEPGGLPGPVQREQVATSVVVTAVAGVMVQAELAVLAESLVVGPEAAGVVAELRAAQVDAVRSGSGPGEYYSFFIDSAFGIASVTLLHDNPEGSQPPGYLIL